MRAGGSGICGTCAQAQTAIATPADSSTPAAILFKLRSVFISRPFFSQPHRARLSEIVRRTVAANMGQSPHVIRQSVCVHIGREIGQPLQLRDARQRIRTHDENAGNHDLRPGVPTLTVRGPYLAISGRQFSWPGKVHIVSDPPTYILSAADWMMLVEKFGLAANVDDAARKG